MKHSLWLLLLFTHLLHADDAGRHLFELYQNGKYTQGCDYGWKVFSQNKTDESFVSLLGFSCLKADRIDRLSPMISSLRETPQGRANGAYFSLIVTQKMLLMQALYDGKRLSNLSFPDSSHLVSKLFSLYLKDPKSGEAPKKYQDPLNPRQSYTLYPTDHNGIKSVAIDEYYDRILIQHHVYY